MRTRVAWRKIRILSGFSSASLLLLLLTVAYLFLRGSPPEIPEAAAVGAAFLLHLVINLFLRKTPCPNCGGGFFSDPASSYVVHPLASSCPLCGIAKYSEFPIAK